MSESALRVFDLATRGGMNITPEAIVVAIRSAMIECTDEMGQVSSSKMFELTCDIENITL